MTCKILTRFTQIQNIVVLYTEAQFNHFMEIPSKMPIWLLNGFLWNKKYPFLSNERWPKRLKNKFIQQNKIPEFTFVRFMFEKILDCGMEFARKTSALDKQLNFTRPIHLVLTYLNQTLILNWNRIVVRTPNTHRLWICIHIYFWRLEKNVTTTARTDNTIWYYFCEFHVRFNPHFMLCRVFSSIDSIFLICDSCRNGWKHEFRPGSIPETGSQLNWSVFFVLLGATEFILFILYQP